MRSFYILIFSFLPILMLGQINDCDNAQIVCNNGPITFNPQGPGMNDFASANNNAGCLASNENSSAWYYFEIEATAPANQQLGFTIDPQGGAGQDYDFALFGPDVPCSNLGSPIRCSYAGPGCAFCPQTGLGNGTTDVSEGAGGDGFVSEITVQPGEGYFLLVDNFSNTGVGFDLTWTGSGSNYLNCNAMPPCGLIADAGNPVSGCEGSSTLSLNGSAIGNGGTETYSWVGTNGSTAYLSNPNIATPTLNFPPGVSGSFDFTLTVDENGCNDMDVVTVTINPAPIVTLNQPLPICDDDGPISLSGSPLGGTWSANAPNGIINPAVLGSGIFIVDYTYIDANGCSNTASTQVTINASPIANIGFFNTQICENDLPTFLTATPPGGTWGNNTPGGNLIPANIGVGNWLVTYTYTDPTTGCMDMTDVPIVIFPEPTASIINPGPLCETGNAVILQATPPGGTWGPTTPGGAFLPSNFPPGTYPVTYTYTAAFGCTTTVTENITVVPAPAVDILPPPALCTSSNAYTLMATPAGGTWNAEFPNGVVDPSVLGAGQFTAIYTYQDPTGCLLVDTEIINITAPPTVTIDPVGDLCVNGNPQNLNANPAGGTWSANATNGVFNPSSFTPGNYTVTYDYTDPNSGCAATSSLNIQVVAEPTVGISGSSSFCSGTSTVLTADPGFSSYSWSNNQGTNSINVNSQGTYTVTVTDASGCTATAQQTVTESNAITPNISGVTSICAGASTTLSADPGFSSYAWSNNTFTSSISVNNAGTYTVTVTDASNCTGTADVTVSFDIPPLPSIVGNPSFCTGETTTLSTQTFSSYIWSENSTTPSITVGSPGLYTVTVTDTNGCTGTAELNVSENTVSPPNISGDLGFCTGNSTTLTANGNFTNYIWTTGSTTSSTTVSQSGNVGVTVTDSNGCTSENSVIVAENNNPTPSISGILSFCTGTSTTLDVGTGFASYSWSNNGNSNSITVNQAGTYTVTVTDMFGCTGEDQVTVNITPELQPTISGNVSICDGASATLDAQVGFNTYIWSNNETTSSITVSNTGTYTVTVTDAVGCTGSAVTTVSSNTSPTPTITGVTTFCPGETTIVSTQTFASYLWSDNSMNQDLVVSSTGTYTVTVTDGNGCTGTAETSVQENPTTLPTIDGDLDFCTGNSTTLNINGTFNSYLWSNNDNNPSTTISQGGTVSVTVTDGNGCTTEASVIVSENPLPTPTITGASSICTGTSTTLDVGNNFTNYIWSDNSVGNSIAVTQAGTYSVTVTDAQGCTGVDQFSVTVTPELEPTITGDANFCNGGSSTLDAGGGYTNYAWSNNANNQTISASATGTFTVTVTDASGCTGTDEFFVNELPVPMPQISGSTSFCTGTSTTLDVGTTWSSYIWSESSTTNSISVATAGTYTVTVTDAQGCTGVASVDIIESTSLNPVIVGELGFCPNESTTLDAGLGFDTYTWTGGATTQTLEVMQVGNYTVTVSDATGCTGTATVSVIENTPPSPTITGQSSFCTGTSTTLDVGLGFVSYSWTGGSTDPTLNVTQAGTYTVIVTDDNGCTGEASLMVQELASLDPAITGDPDFCEGSSTVIAAASGFENYIWSDNSTMESLEITQQGTYTVTVTDINGCTGEESYFVSENTNPSPTLSGDNDFCPTTSATIIAEAGYSEYLWSDNSADEELTVTTQGTYTITVTDGNGCTGSVETMITELPEPSTVILGTPSFCPNESTTLDAGNGFFNYEWSNNTFTQIATIDQTGIYTVTVTDGNGCTTTAQTNVQENIPPTPAIVGASSFCSGNSTSLDATGNFTSYIWSNASIDPIIDVNQSGTYTVTVTDLNGCTGTTELEVTETASLSPTFTGETDFCPNENTIIEAEAGYATYEWSDGVTTTNNITITNAGTYTVTVSDVNGCTGTNSIEVFENTPPIPMIAGSATFCTGASTTLDVGGNYSAYLWSDNSINSTLDVDTDGIFSVTVTDANGCTGETSIQVTESTQLQPVISGDDSFCSGESTLLDAGAGFVTYSWSNNTNDQILNVNTPGTYTVIVSDASGCTGETSLTITENMPVNAGVANAPTALCSVDDMVINLQGELVGADMNGVWSETSGTPSSGTAFDPTTGEFNTDGQAVGTYTFEYFLAGTGTCPDDMEIVTVVIEETPTAFIEPAEELNCDITSTDLDASNSLGGANLSYQWSIGNMPIGNNSPMLNVDAAGIYELVIELPNGCTSTTSMEVTQDITPPTADAGINQQLTCTDGQATLTGNSNTSGVNYLWNGPGINSTNMNEQNPTVASAGTYTLIVSNPTNGCESVIASVEVIANIDAPTFTLDNVGALDCNISSQLLTGPFATNFAYQWLLNGNEILGATDQTYEATQPGFYSLQITNTDNGCNSIESVEVIESIDEPTVDAGTSDLLTCSVGTVTLTGNSSPSTGVTYQWLDPNSNPITNSNSTSIQASQSGTYTFIVTNDTNGCSATDQVTVLADNDFPIVDAGPNVTLDCDFNSVQLGGNPPTGVSYSYAWITISGGTVSNPSIANPTTNTPGVYELQVTDTNNNCTATAQVIVSQTTDIPTDVDLDITPISCEGDSDGAFTILNVEGGTPPYQYAFDGGSYSTVNTFPFLSAGDYSINVVDAQGCELQTQMTLDEPIPFIIDLGPDTTIQLGESVDLLLQSVAPYDSLWWRFDSTLPCDDCPNPTVEPIQTTSYMVSAINGNGCIDSDDITVFVEKNRNVFIPNVFTPNDDGVNDLFMIFGGDDVEKIHTFKIFNRWGESIFELTNFQPNDVTKGWDGYFNGKKMNPAVFVYFAEIEFKDGQKIIFKGDVALRR